MNGIFIPHYRQYFAGNNKNLSLLYSPPLSFLVCNYVANVKEFLKNGTEP